MPQIKQIGGRAGRFGMNNAFSTPSAPDMDEPSASATASTTQTKTADNESSTNDNGKVMTLIEGDMPLLARAMKSPVKQLQKAVVLPTQLHLERLWNLLAPEAKYSQMLRMIHLLARTGPNYRLPVKHHQIETAALLDNVSGLTLDERASLAAAPVSLRDERVTTTFVEWATAVGESRTIDLEDWAKANGALDLIEEGRVDLNAAELLQIESFHRSLSLYLWLSYRLQFAFRQQVLAREYRSKAESAIDANLSSGSDAGPLDRRAPFLPRHGQTLRMRR